ncbi:MAG: hypothetical protein V8Q75_06410 [Bacilli bacterium]
MNLFKAKNERERLKNNIYIEANKIAIEFNKTQPKASDVSKEIIKNGKITDKNLQYLIDTDDTYKKLREMQEQFKILDTYISIEEERMKRYEPITYKIVELKELYNLTWENIGIRMGISKSWACKLYEKYQNEKEIDVFVIEKIK